MATNSNLQMSRATRADEFYIQLSTIGDELWHYREFFEGKIEDYMALHQMDDNAMI